MFSQSHWGDSIASSSSTVAIGAWAPLAALPLVGVHSGAPLAAAPLAAAPLAAAPLDAAPLAAGAMAAAPLAAARLAAAPLAAAALVVRGGGRGYPGFVSGMPFRFRKSINACHDSGVWASPNPESTVAPAAEVGPVASSP